jgi:hypothetical protein
MGVFRLYANFQAKDHPTDEMPIRLSIYLILTGTSLYVGHVLSKGFLQAYTVSALIIEPLVSIICGENT